MSASVGFIKKKFVTMQGHMNVRKSAFVRIIDSETRSNGKMEGMSSRTYHSVTVRLVLKAVIFLSLSRADTEYLT